MPDGPSMFAPIVERLRRTGLNYASVYAISSRFWQFLAGPVTLLLMARCFTEEEQGWYYTLASLLGLQTLCELGLMQTLVLVSANLWGGIEGRGPRDRLAEAAAGQGSRRELARVAALRRDGQRWMSGVALAFVILAGLGGTWFLSRTVTEVDWLGPWLVAIACSAGSLPLAVDLAILEGCERTAPVHRARLWQAIAGNCVVWGALAAGAGLWIVPLGPLVRLTFEFVLVWIGNRAFWRSLPPAHEARDWSWARTVGGLQWRAATQAILVYLSTQLFTPILFRVHGPVVAGRFGMTWSILTTLQNAASAWVQARGVEFSILARQGRLAEFERLYRHVSRSSLMVLAVAVAGVTAVLSLIGLLGPADWQAGLALWLPESASWLISRLGRRLLDPLATVLLGIGVVAMHPPMCQVLAVRSRMVDPWVWPAVVLNLLLGSLTAVGAWLGGTTGLAAAYAGTTCLVVMPVVRLLWRRFERASTQDESTAGTPAGIH